MSIDRNSSPFIDIRFAFPFTLTIAPSRGVFLVASVTTPWMIEVPV